MMGRQKMRPMKMSLPKKDDRPGDCILISHAADEKKER